MGVMEAIKQPDNLCEFPVARRQMDQNGYVVVYEELGMTLRDYFAGQALVGYLGGRAQVHSTRLAGLAIASTAYVVADAMLRAREGK